MMQYNFQKVFIYFQNLKVNLKKIQNVFNQLSECSHGLGKRETALTLRSTTQLLVFFKCVFPKQECTATTLVHIRGLSVTPVCPVI